MFGAVMTPGNVMVATTSNRGFTPEEIADRMVAKIIAVADTAPPPIKDQALAFKERLIPLCAFYLREAARSDRTTVSNKLRDAGFPDAADIIARI